MTDEPKGISQETKDKMRQVKTEAVDKMVIEAIVKMAIDEAQVTSAEEAIDYFVNRIQSMDFAMFKLISANLKARTMPTATK